MKSRSSVLVVIPARDEESTIQRCLEAVLAAADEARLAGMLDRVRIVLAAHRCTDSTAALAAASLDGGGHLVLAVEDDITVGELRSRAVDAGLRDHDTIDWILSTDADSTVPLNWIERLLAVAATTCADAVAGLTSLADWAADEPAHRAYEMLLAAGMTADGHSHVYAANLAVRRAAYVRAGGFPGDRHGEEQGLVDAIRAQGGVVIGALEPVVVTSARMPGRAEAGLGALLANLSLQAREPQAG